MDCSPARTRDPIEWLDTCPEFSWPLANRLREWILEWEPDLAETIKWNMLCFTGRKLVCGISACKQHLGLTFFRGTELPDPQKLFVSGGENNTNIRSVRLTRLDEALRPALRDLLRAAVELDAEPAIPALPKKRRTPIAIPEFFAETLKLKKNRAAAENFEKLPPTCRREYIVWLTFAKLPETRERRLKQTLAALSKGRKWIQRNQG